MKKLFSFVMVVLLLAYSSQGFAHFGMLISSDNMVMQDENRTLSLQLSFSHPMEMIGMDLDKPKAVKVVAGDQQYDLLGPLKSIRVMDHAAWGLDYQIKRPGVYTFYMEPQPYWEPVEDVFIIHHTKTVVTAFGDDEGWDHEIGLRTEIVPLSKPFGLYKGNVFQGVVKVNGRPVPFAEVEIEYFNQAAKAHAPTGYMVTQSVRADPNGVFTYAVPAAGWWGFAALSDADFTLKTTSGQPKGVELGAVIWVHFEDWQ